MAMGRISDSFSNPIGLRVLNWAGPIARIVLAIILLELVPGTQNVMLYILVAAWTIWGTFGIAAAFGDRPLTGRVLEGFLILDIAMLSATALMVDGLNITIIGMLLCVGATAAILGQRWSFYIFLASFPTLAWFLRDYFDLAIAARTSLSSRMLSLTIELLGIWALSAAVYRLTRLTEFRHISQTVGTFLPDRSFGFDLSAWMPAFAELYQPKKALVVIEPDTVNGPMRWYEQLSSPRSPQLPDEQVRSAIRLFDAPVIVDLNQRQLLWPNTGAREPLEDKHRQFMSLLSSAGLTNSYCHPVKIDRSLGLVCCEVVPPINALLTQESLMVGKAISEMADLLSSAASNQRQLILDAHDVARRDLHDGVLQSLAALRMRLATFRKRSDLGPEASQEELRKIDDLIAVEQKRLRGFLANDERGDNAADLVFSLNVAMSAMALQWQVEIKFASEEPAVPVDRQTALNIENLMREIVANAIRHASSQKLMVSLALRDSYLMLAVKDLGQGATPATDLAMPLESASLKQRLKLVNGKAYVEGLDTGTLLAVHIPMQQVEHD